MRPSRRRLQIGLMIVCLFLLAFGVRLLYWQDNQLQVSSEVGLLRDYRQEAQRMIDDGGILFPSESVNTSSAHMVMHPPGYSILLLAIYGKGVYRDSYTALILVQVICDSAAAALVSLICMQLLPVAVAVVAGLMVAFSPHFSYYSLNPSPESIAALPVLIAILLLIRAVKRPKLVTIVVVGVLAGISCWLRANAMLLAPFIALSVLFIFERGRRLRYSLALMAAAVVVIAPITIRNLAIYHRFIPLSLGTGITLIQGIADYDAENRFKMPVDDNQASLQEAEMYGRPEYANSLWYPDGIKRENERLARGIEVIRSNPFWFAGVMTRRAYFMLTYDKPHKNQWPFNTVVVPPVLAEPSFGHVLRYDEGSGASWSSSAYDLADTGRQLAAQSSITLEASRSVLRVSGDNSEFGDQFASALIPTYKNTDYVLALSLNSLSGSMAVKITSADRRITLASAILSPEGNRRRRKAKRTGDLGQLDQDQTSDSQMGELNLAFASGDRSEVLLVISNNGASPVSHEIEIGEARLYNLGPTPYIWTRAVRTAVRGIQRNLYTTSRMLPMVIIGVILLLIAGRKRATALLLIVPAYYLLAQSALHTEYRYILVIHYFLFIMAAVSFYSAGKLIRFGARWAVKKKMKKDEL